VRQQLILASYHLCTQGYPEPFLSLPFSARQQLQQAIRKLGQNAAEQLIAGIKIEVSEEILDLTQAKPNQNHYPSNPKLLIQWQQNLEQAIANTLKTSSHETNRLLQQAGILPKTLPAPVLEAAMNASASGEAMAGPPNLLNLLIETENQPGVGSHHYTYHRR
jgi:hypothetical protein